jgi:hypothetical protein
MKANPDHEDARLLLQLYDLRREAVMRQSRTAMAREFWPRTFEDVQAITQLEHPLNAAFRQTSGYWEMVFGMAHHGIAHAEYLVEFSGEGLLLFAKLEPFLPEIRDKISPTALRHSEWAAYETENGRRLMALFRKRISALRDKADAARAAKPGPRKAARKPARKRR